MLHEFLHANSDKIVALARTMAAARLSPTATKAELSHGIPLFMNQLIEALRRSESRSSAIEESAGMHGADLLNSGFTYAQVVHDYGNVCQAVTGLAHEMNVPISADEFRTLNRCLDEGIAGAITEYGRLRDRSIDDEEREYVGVLSAELRNPLEAASLAYQILRTAAVGMGGSTGAALDGNLRRISSVIDRTMARVRLDAGVQSRERVSVFEFVEELEIGASMEADARELVLSVAPVERGVDVEVDRQLATAAVANLLQNAFQFTRPRGHVALNTSWTIDRVVVNVEDECGGLSAERVGELSRAFAQQGADRAGLGAGLSISRRSAEAIGGKIRVRDVPGIGCVFTIDLPRQRPP
jgi:signal transduction histidine kinase